MSDQPVVNNTTNIPSGQKSVVPQVTAPVPTTEAGKFDLLLKLMLTQEARRAEAEEAMLTALKARNAQREKSAIAHQNKILVKQARCRHLKGGKAGPRSGVVDYNVYTHTFINGEPVIKCHSCQAKWKRQDTTEFLVRGGKNIPNHTKIGWEQARMMAAQSTNQASTSEVPMEAKPVAEFSEEALN